MSRFRNIDSREGNPARTGPADFSTGNETNRQTQTGDGGDLSWSAGLILRSEDADWSLGAVYREAPEFDVDYRFQWTAEAQARVLATANPNAADPGIESALSGASVLRLPDSWSVGSSLRLWQRFRVSFDYTHVRYSQLLPAENVLVNLVSPSNCGEFTRSGASFEPPVPCGVSSNRFARFAIDDDDEIHLGFEVVVGRQPKLALRLGAWLDPDHQLRFEIDDQLPGAFGDSPIANSVPPLDRLATRFLPGQDEVHFTGGLGLIPSRERLQIDLAADVSDRGEIFSLSAVYRW